MVERSHARFEAIDGMHRLGFLRGMLQMKVAINAEHDLILIICRRLIFAFFY